MQESGKAGLGRFVRQGAEHLCLIRPKGDALALETLFIAEDVNSQAEIEEAVAESEVKEAELGLAQQVIDSLEGEFDPTELTSEYRQNLKQMLEAKLDGQEIAKPEPVEETPVVDLMEALKKSVAEVKEKKPAKTKSRLEGRLPEARGGAKERLEVLHEARASGAARAQRRELSLEEGLVDLALVDRHAFLHTDADHLLAIDSHLLRELLGRQVVRHAAPPLLGRAKKPAGSWRGRAGFRPWFVTRSSDTPRVGNNHVSNFTATSRRPQRPVWVTRGSGGR